jgi:hypothetical protein
MIATECRFDVLRIDTSLYDFIFCLLKINFGLVSIFLRSLSYSLSNDFFGFGNLPFPNQNFQHIKILNFFKLKVSIGLVFFWSIYFEL